MQMPSLTYTPSDNQSYQSYQPFAYNPQATTTILAFSSFEAPMPFSRETSATSFPAVERRSSLKVEDFNTEWKLQVMEPRGSSSNFQVMDGFQLEDLLAFAQFADLKTRETKDLLGQLREAISRWTEFCDQAGVGQTQREQVRAAFRTIG